MSHDDSYLQALRERVVVFDGAMGTSLQAQELTAEDFGGKRYEGCNDYLVLVKPGAVEQVHRGFLEVGCDVIETCTFQATRRRLEEWGLAKHTYELNLTAARLARRLADDYGTPAQPRWVAGSMGPTGFLPGADDPVLSNITYDELAELVALDQLPVGRASEPFVARQARDSTFGYLEKRLEQVRYTDFLALGYPIGSGAVESANKLVVEVRLTRGRRSSHRGPSLEAPLLGRRARQGRLPMQNFDGHPPAAAVGPREDLLGPGRDRRGDPTLGVD